MVANLSQKPMLDVAIVGGGIGGLCLAIGLLKYRTVNVQVYEGATKFSELGAGLTVGPNARRALKLISPGAEQAFLNQATGNSPDIPTKKNVFCRFIHGAGPKSGETITESWCDNGQQSVHRAHFLDELVKLVPKEITHFKKRLTVLEQGADGRVTLSFEDGTEAVADCVVGADGVHSVVRKQIVPPDHPAYHPEFCGSAAYRGLIPLAEAKAAVGDAYTQVASMFCAPGGFIMTYPADFQNLWNIVACDLEVGEWNGASSRPADADRMKEKFSSWGPTAQKIISLLDRPGLKMWSLWQLPPLPSFTSSRLVLMGDAAHATNPYQGQGAGQAIEDALVLANLLGRLESIDDLELSLQAFDRIRRPRSQKVVKTSFEAGKIFSMSLPGLTNDEKLFREHVDDRYDWIFNRDIQLQIDQAFMMVEEMKIKDI